MPDPGLLEYKLFDGACIVDSFVESGPERAAAAFGEPIKLAENGQRIDGVELAGIDFYAAGWSEIGWSVIEAVGASDAEPDYIITMLRQAAAALEGSVLELSRAYENGLGLAQEAAQLLGARALVLWGSDEWNSLGGGAQLGATGEVTTACNIAAPDSIARALADREAMDLDDDDADFEDDEDEEEEDVLFVYEPGKPLAKLATEPLAYLDAWLKQCGIPQPEMPPSLLDFAASYYGEIWGARPS